MSQSSKVTRENLNNQEHQILNTSEQEKANQPKKRLKWRKKETMFYLKFVIKYQSKLNEKQKCKKQKVYNQMADFVQTRKSRQCKSHHQKMLQKHQSIEKIIENLTKQVNRDQTEKINSVDSVQVEQFLKDQTHLFAIQSSPCQRLQSKNLLEKKSDASEQRSDQNLDSDDEDSLQLIDSQMEVWNITLHKRQDLKNKNQQECFTF